MTGIHTGACPAQGPEPHPLTTGLTFLLAPYFLVPSGTLFPWLPPTSQTMPPTLPQWVPHSELSG